MAAIDEVAAVVAADNAAVAEEARRLQKKTEQRIAPRVGMTRAPRDLRVKRLPLLVCRGVVCGESAIRSSVFWKFDASKNKDPVDGALADDVMCLEEGAKPRA